MVSTELQTLSTGRPGSPGYGSLINRKPSRGTHGSTSRERVSHASFMVGEIVSVLFACGSAHTRSPAQSSWHPAAPIPGHPHNPAGTLQRPYPVTGNGCIKGERRAQQTDSRSLRGWLAERGQPGRPPPAAIAGDRVRARAAGQHEQRDTEKLNAAAPFAS